MKSKKSYKVFVCPKCGEEVVSDKPYAVSYSFEFSSGLLAWLLALALVSTVVYLWIEILA